MNAFLRIILKKTAILLLFPLRIFPVREGKVVLLNDIMNKDANFSSNPKYIAMEILEQNNNRFNLIYAIGKGSDRFEAENEGIKTVKLKSFSYFYHVMTCQFFITTSGGISYIPFRKNQIVINSWHGGGAYKKMGLDFTDDVNLRKALEISEKKTTYFISSNKYFSDAIKSAFLIPTNKILNYGLPRNDIFFNENQMKVATDKVYSHFGLSKETKIVLYAPTYRSADESIFKKHVLGPYDIDYSMVLTELSEKFGGDWVFAIRLHPSISELEMELPKYVINASNYVDPQELMCASDVLINDYSSTMWDFSLTRKPCFIYASDLGNYNQKLGFYTEPNSWPFPLSKTNNELSLSIRNFDNDSYLKQLDDYFGWMKSYETGSSCNQLVNLMKKKSGVK